jgi:aspartate carbamoyltransferase catalytic subunit
MSRHIVESQQFSPHNLIKLFKLIKTLEYHQKTFGIQEHCLKGKIIATLFYQPSTRTRLSFESAIMRLGGQVLTTENAKEFSSAAKGETIEDTVRVIGQYADAIIIRHYEEGTVARAAAVSPVPIINAGDGPGQHPTQALLDAYTIYKHFGNVSNLKIQFVGDLANGRTVRSLVYFMAKFPRNYFIFVSPKSLRMKNDILEYLKVHHWRYQETTKIQTEGIDVTYATRIQEQCFADPEDFKQVFGTYIIDNKIANKLPEKSIIMHPLPRVNEIMLEVDSNPRAKYFEQAGNGPYVRMAILKQIFAEHPFLFKREEN